MERNKLPSAQTQGQTLSIAVEGFLNESLYLIGFISMIFEMQSIITEYSISSVYRRKWPAKNSIFLSEIYAGLQYYAPKQIQYMHYMYTCIKTWTTQPMPIKRYKQK